MFTVVPVMVTLYRGHCARAPKVESGASKRMMIMKYFMGHLFSPCHIRLMLEVNDTAVFSERRRRILPHGPQWPWGGSGRSRYLAGDVLYPVRGGGVCRGDPAPDDPLLCSSRLRKGQEARGSYPHFASVCAADSSAAYSASVHTR
jgi:hypothetical protein